MEGDGEGRGDVDGANESGVDAGLERRSVKQERHVRVVVVGRAVGGDDRVVIDVALSKGNHRGREHVIGKHLKPAAGDRVFAKVVAGEIAESVHSEDAWDGLCCRGEGLGDLVDGEAARSEFRRVDEKGPALDIDGGGIAAAGFDGCFGGVEGRAEVDAKAAMEFGNKPATMVRGQGDDHLG